MTNEIITVEAREVQKKNFMQGELVDRFIRFAGVSEKSASTYKIALRQLFKYFAANDIAKPTREHLENWRDGLISGAIDGRGITHYDGEKDSLGRMFCLEKVNATEYAFFLVDTNGAKKDLRKSASTVQLYLTSAKIFFKWLNQENVYPNIADNLKSRVKINHEHKKDALDASNAGKLIKNCQGDSIKAKRDRAILALMMTAGLRTIEVSRADVEDMVREFGRTFLRVQGKGRSEKAEKVLLPAQVVALINDYLKARDNDKAVALFTSTANRNRGSRLSTQTISKMVKSQLRAAGFDTPRLTAHSLRHTAATTMILAGVELTQVQQVLRHVNINTTMIYNNSVQRMKNIAEQTAANAIFDSISA